MFLCALGATVAAGLTAAAIFGLYSIVHYALTHFSNIWTIYSLMPDQTPTVVFLEYAAVGALHGGLGMNKWRKGDKTGALFHFLSMGAAFAFPTYYFLAATPIAPMRLHHSFEGLALSLLPFNTAKAIGTTIALDSALYFFSPFGHYEAWNKRYDFMNILLANKETYIPALTAMGAAEYTIARILPKKEVEDRPQPVKAPPLKSTLKSTSTLRRL